MTPEPIRSPFVWPDQLEIDGVTYRMWRLSGALDGTNNIVIVEGLPVSSRRRILEASQGSEVPHGWRVGETPIALDQVTDEILAAANTLLDDDLRATKPLILTYFAETPSGALTTAACVTSRTLMSSTYQSERWAVGTRMIVHPDLRRSGISIALRQTLAQVGRTHWGTPLAGYFFPTDHPFLLKGLRAQKAAGERVVWLGAKHYRESLVTVHGVFYPGMADWVDSLGRSLQNEAPFWRELFALTHQALMHGMPFELSAQIYELWHQRPEYSADMSPAFRLYTDALATFEAFGLLTVPQRLWPLLDKACVLE